MTPNATLERHAAPLLALLVVLGLALRAAAAWTWWLNGDEGVYYFIAHSPWSIAAREIEANAHPPLFYWLLRPIAALTDAPAALRIPSIVLSSAGIPVLFAIGRQLAGAGTGLLAAALWAVLPAPVELGHVARPYAFQWTLLAVALLCMIAIVRAGRVRALAGFSGALCLAAFLHYGTFLAAAAFGACLTWLWVRGAIPRRHWRALLLAFLPIAAVVGALLWAHVAPKLIGTRMQADATEGWLSAFFVDGAGSAWQNLLGLCEYLGGRGFSVAVAVAWLFGVLCLLRRGERVLLGATVALLVLGLLLSALGLYPLGATRHAGLFAVVIVPAIAFGLGELLGARPRARWPGLAALALLLLLHEPIERALGVPGHRAHRADELEITVAEARSMERRLAALADRPGVVIADMGSALTLEPLLRAARGEALPGGDTGLIVLPWGRHRLVLTHDWILQVLVREVGAPHHLAAVLARIPADLPELGSSLAHGVRVLSAFGNYHVRSLRRLESDGPGAAKIVGAVERDGRLVLLEVDAAAYAAAIAARR